MFSPSAYRILIVEDNSGTATLQKRAVERAGYETVLASTAEEGLAAVREGSIHLVLLDNRLPGEMTGLEFLTTLKALAPELPVIMVTGSEAEGAVVQALRGGARDFIHKDVDYLDHLPKAVAAVLQQTGLEKQLRNAGSGAQRGVLVLDPSHAGAALESRQLERAGFGVFVAHDTAEALRVLGEQAIGLLVVDHGRDHNGVQAYRQITEAGHAVPAILVSAGADDQTAITALRSGFRDFVLKDGEYLLTLQEAVQRLFERVRLEEQLAESKARLMALVNSALDPILLLDEDLRITMFNPAAEQLFETKAAEATGKPIGRYIPGVEERLGEAESGEPARFDARGLSHAGKSPELELSAARMDAGGRRFVSVIARDVTRRRELERLLLQKDKLESLGLLAGGIAHDFNNLLVGIMGNASLALETISSNNPARAMLKDVVLASETAGNLTRQLLAYAGKGRFIIEPVDLSDLVRQISNLLQTSIPKSVQLRLELMDGLPSFEADITQIQQLIMNLVINGAEAIEDAHGTVLITTGVQHVDEDYIATALTSAQISPGNYVNLQVHDNGAGMSQETLDRIFDPFFTTKFTGRGLGLAAVLGIVRGHNGAVKVYSTVGQGTTFKVLFPASDQQAQKRQPHATVQHSQEGETVMVVDDEQIVRRTAKAMLERYGYSVVLAENGKEAVELFNVLSDKIDVVLLDMTMPVMGGEETFRQLKMLRGDVRVILSSGYNEVEAIRRFTGKGLAGFMQKPYSALTLTEKVRAVLQESRGTAQS
jgi:PAS domain S-box-containing protein